MGYLAFLELRGFRAHSPGVHMRVFREMPKLEGANPQRVTDLSFRGALRELCASARQQKERSAEEEHTRRSILQRFDGYIEFTENLGCHSG